MQTLTNTNKKSANFTRLSVEVIYARKASNKSIRQNATGTVRQIISPLDRRILTISGSRTTIMIWIWLYFLELYLLYYVSRDDVFQLATSNKLTKTLFGLFPLPRKSNILTSKTVRKASIFILQNKLFIRNVK